MEPHARAISKGERPVIECFMTGDDGTVKVDRPQPGCWVSIVAPTPEEREWLQTELSVMPEFLSAALDDEERPHIDFDDDSHQTLIIVDCPFVEEEADTKSREIVQYDTHPLSFLFLPDQDMIVTVTTPRNETIAAFSDAPRLRTINTNQRTRLFLRMMLHISQRYQVYLRNINRQFTRSERRLRESMRNEELMQMLGFQNSLVYFSISLKADETVLTRINKGRVIRMYEEDADLLEDVSIEFRQAIEMCTIYTDILEVTTDTFSSIINNNVNQIMRRLTIITLVLAIPTIVFSFYGMNIAQLPGMAAWWIPVTIALAACFVAGLIMWRTRTFR